MAAPKAGWRALATHYYDRYKTEYGKAPTFNWITSKWNFEAILMGMSLQEAKDLIDYYFITPNTKLHDLGWFFNNYEKLVRAKQELAEDAAHRARLMEESEKRAAQWRNSGRQGIGNN
jgi:hypothetical protein